MIISRVKFCILALSFISTVTFSQEDFYDWDKLAEIELIFEEDNWAEILDNYYVAGEKQRLLGSVIINGTRLDSVGIRYKGFSSVSVGRTKNPFNIKLNHVNAQTYKGIKKLKLSNVIHDPTFVREALSYEIARKYMPACESNFARVYANGEYLGVYSNVEAVNKDFVTKHFGSDTNPFFKGSPESLSFTGENSNLSNTPGTDTSSYFPFYDIESDNGWTELVNFIQLLNEEPSRVEELLNVDRALWMHAFNYALVNFDSYIGYAQNYYLYQDDLGQFNTIPWDMNMSFGSYSVTDASDFFDGFSPVQAKTLDPLAHYNSVSVTPRPLMRNLFENDTYRRMFLAHIRTINNKFYTTESFKSNVSETYNDLISYPGLTDLMDARSNYLLDYPGIKDAPRLDIIDQIDFADEGEIVEIEVVSPLATSVHIYYRSSKEERWVKQEMSPMGMGMWSTGVEMKGASLDYYVYGENEMAGTFLPARAAYEFYTILPLVENKLEFNEIVINEIMATQQNNQADEVGEYDDWIELYNTTSNPLPLAGVYLSDKRDQVTKWALPDTIIPADDYMIVWADEDGSQGPMHANFKLSAGGEYISLAYADGSIVDTLTYGEQVADVSYGRLPNGTGPFGKLQPTFSAPNEVSSIKELLDTNPIELYPNPTQNSLTLNLTALSVNKIKQVRLLDLVGRKIKSLSSDNQQITLDVEGLIEGLYIIEVQIEDQYFTRTFIKE